MDGNYISPKNSDGWHSWILWVNDVIICNTIYRRRRSSQGVVLNILHGESTKKERERDGNMLFKMCMTSWQVYLITEWNRRRRKKKFFYFSFCCKWNCRHAKSSRQWSGILHVSLERAERVSPFESIFSFLAESPHIKLYNSKWGKFRKERILHGS